MTVSTTNGIAMSADLGLDAADRDDVEAGTAAETVDPVDVGGARTAAARTPAGAPDAARRRGSPGDDDRRDQRVAMSEARALVERSERLHPRMTPEDRIPLTLYRFGAVDDPPRTQAGLTQ
jgi:hypothetical protein